MNAPFTRPVPQILGGAALAAPDTTRPVAALYFPSAGGVQAIDVTGAVFNIASSSGSIIPVADNVDDLGSAALRWRAGYFGTSVATPQLSTLVGGARVAVASLASAASAVNTVLLEGAATGNAVTVGAYSDTDTNVILRLAGQNAGAINLFAGGGTVLGVQNVSSTFFGVAAENVQNTTGGAGPVTVNAVSGSFRVSAGQGAAGIVINNNRVLSAASVIIAVPKRVDATIGRFSCLAASGSFTFTSNANATADTDFQFIVINAAV